MLVSPIITKTRTLIYERSQPWRLPIIKLVADMKPVKATRQKIRRKITFFSETWEKFYES